VEVRRMERHFKMGDHRLVQEGLIVNGCESGMADTETYTLTLKAKETFLADFDLKEKKLRSIKNLIEAASIAELEMFYPPSVACRVGELAGLLREENFSLIKKRLAGKKMSAAFTILFQGPPGTGKTETAYQIARLTGRSLCLVDISETKSQWFGESEKRIKAVFDRYKAVVSGGGLTPILFFNEADAVLGRRQELGGKRHGPAQTENAIQNIILQEMETLHGGILIATTNMISNFDKAFERRFLYKIEFEKPDLKARAQIWHSRLPELAAEDAESISRRYDFSGGQIENIARRQTISAILHNSPLTLDSIAALCEDELLEKTEKRIGFHTNDE
jgi:SpoVK/Ycf46/Vps4 family AAA+-type ATPase